VGLNDRTEACVTFTLLKPKAVSSWRSRLFRSGKFDFQISISSGVHGPDVQILTTTVFRHHNLTREVRCTGDACEQGRRCSEESSF